MKKITAAFILSFLFFSCDEATDWDYQSGQNNKLVVEAIVTNELRQQELKLSLSYDELNGSPLPVTGAQVFVNDGQNDFVFSEATTQPGTYRSNQDFAAKANQKHTLNINYNGDSYQAESAMVQVFPLPNISFRSIKESDSLVIEATPNLFSTSQQAMYIVDIDWSQINSPITPKQAQLVFYTFQTIDVNGLFAPDEERVVFPKGSEVIIGKYGLNDEYADYLRALAMETEWQGGFLDEASSSLPTNISNGGLGFFSVCAVLRDTVFAE